MFLNSLRTWVAEITWKRFSRAARFMLLFSALCIVFSIAISWVEMQVYLLGKGPGYASEFVGMYLVVGFIFGQFSCALAFPALTLIYLKAPSDRAKWYAASASIAASICVWLFFYSLKALE